MIVQCEECQTRFRLADEKLKSGGIKVRCSKCKHIFRVEPPREETPAPPVPEPQPTPPSDQPPPESGEFRPETGAATAAPSDSTEAEVDFAGFNMEKVPEEEEEIDFQVERDPDNPSEISFSEEEEKSEDGGFSFSDSGDQATPEPPSSDGEVGEEDEMFSFEDTPSEEESDFSFSGETAPDDEFSWGEEDSPPSPDDFEFEKPAPPTAEEDLGFGEISLPGSESGSDAAGSASSAELAPELPEGAGSMEDTWHEPPSAAAPEPMAAPPAKRKGGGKGLQLFVLFILLLVGGAIGYLYLQEGTVNIQAARNLVDRLMGKGPSGAAEQAVEITDLKGKFITNRHEGQLFVINGTALNRFKAERSAIQIKGMIFNQGGKVILQQTAFAGNPIDDKALKTWSFPKISETMSNQFGDSLSNLNLGSGKTIKFTIVFKNLPAEMSEFSAEVVDSQPGSK